MHRLAERGRSLDDFTYNDAVSAGEIYSAMNATQFLGVSVRLLFVMSSWFFYDLNAPPPPLSFCSNREQWLSAPKVTVLLGL